MRGSRAYIADEYYDGELSPKLDVYSFGVVNLKHIMSRYLMLSYSRTSNNRHVLGADRLSFVWWLSLLNYELKLISILGDTTNNHNY